MAFADEYQGVEAHGNTKLHVIHTNDKKQVAITLAKPALCQLSIGKKHPVLLFQLSAAERCIVFDNFLADPRYTFAGFSIDGDKKRLERVNLEVANFVDIQKEWRVPEATKELDSLGDVSGMLIDDYYNNMKKKITDDEHKRWATLPLSMRHIEYAAKDAYAAYEIWNRITLTQDGLRRAKLEKEEPPRSALGAAGDGETLTGEDEDGAGQRGTNASVVLELSSNLL
ncbi:uncharacterized protein [Aegilops tauschii subsp. strangulata]|uniref:uncharacterized protein n=1 Tax=Aegilops tauschii subsp. strangulata TaxID=200361 RepID=UPI003A603090